MLAAAMPMDAQSTASTAGFAITAGQIGFGITGREWIQSAVMPRLKGCRASRVLGHMKADDSVSRPAEVVLTSPSLGLADNRRAFSCH